MAVAFNAKRNPTMADIVRGQVDGKFDRDIVELTLSASQNLGHFVVLPCNNGNNDITTIRTGLSEATWTSFYEGVQPSKGSKAQVVTSCGKLESLIQVDKDLIDSTDDAEAELGDEAFDKAETMANEIMSCIYYGNTKVNGKKFNGLSPIHNKLCTADSTKNDSEYYTLGAKRSTQPDSTALRSIWLIGHGRMGTSLRYPKGSSAGLERGPLEDQTVTTPDGKRLKVKEQFFKWKTGLVNKDFRTAVRIANIESNNVEALDLDVGEYMLKAMVRVRKTGVNLKFYMPGSLYEWLCVKTRRDIKNSHGFTFAEHDGELVLDFMGVGVYTEDALEVNEAEVS